MRCYLTATAIAFAVATSAVASAQTSGTQTPAQQAPSGGEMATGVGTMTQQAAGDVMAEKIIGTNVRNPQNENIGSVNDLVIDQDGRVKAAILSVGGFLGLGAKKVAVPWSELQIRTDDSHDLALAINMNREQLTQAPEFKTADDQQRDATRSPSGAPSTDESAPRRGTGAPSGTPTSPSR
jgi:sporulation protein YlmC with PRC-barrel domain